MSHSWSILPYVGTCFGFHLSCWKQMLSWGPFQSVCRMICFFHKLMLQSFIIKIRIVIQQLLLCFVFRVKIGQPWRYLWSSHMNLKFGLFTFKSLMKLGLEKNTSNSNTLGKHPSYFAVQWEDTKAISQLRINWIMFF